MTFLYPAALILLLVLPLVGWIGWPRLRFRRRRDSLSLGLRTLILLLLILAIAGLSTAQPTRKVATLFVMDASDSLGASTRDDQLAAVQQAIAARPPEDSWGIIVFGAAAVIDQPLTTRGDVLPIRSTVDGGQTNLAAALNSALSLFPADATPRIVVLSDGDETLGSALLIAQRAAATDVEISYIPFQRPPVTDVRVTSLEVPGRVAEGQPFDLTLNVSAQQPTAARLLLYRNGQLLQEQALTLQAGDNRYTVAQQIGESGLLDYTAQLIVPNDGSVQNNRLSAFAQVVGAPRVLVIADDAQETAALVTALQDAGLVVDTGSASALPADTAALASYRAVVIANVAADRFSLRQMERLQTYVRDLGGGLVFVGGDRSYGLGGYGETPIEAVLPVEMRIRDQERIPRLTIAYLVDASGSMQTSDDGVFSYLDLARQAIILSVEMLQPDDRAAVGTFDSDGQWVARFQNVEDRTTLQGLVGGLRASGGTDIGAGLRLVERDIGEEPAPLKHVILLTDGGANSNELVNTARRLHDTYGVTITTVGIGTRIPPFLEQMSQVSGGRFYAITDPSQIPTIFAQDTVLATRSYLMAGDLIPAYNALSPIMEGVGTLPALSGYVATTLKDSAQLILRAGEPYNDPILAQWQVGLGRAVAFTSDASQRWGRNWLTWAGFSRFWGQAVSWTITDNTRSNLDVQITQEGDMARITLNARADSGDFLNGAQFVGNVLLPDNTTQALEFRQTNAGEYTATLRPSEEGSYFLAVSGTDTTGQSYSARDGWVKSYSREYIPPAQPSTLLADMATLTGGRDLSADPAAVFAPPANPRTATVPLASWLWVLALLLLPLDIAVRRIIVTRSDVMRLQAWLRPTRATVNDERLSTLLQVKQRTRVESVLPERPLTPSAPTTPTPSSAAPTKPEKPVSGEASTVGALLKRRRNPDE